MGAITGSTVLTDHLQSHAFWLFDAGPLDTFGTPVLSPFAGFSSITAPELELDSQPIQEGTGHQITVVKAGHAQNITLQRGASLGDSDFYNWVSAAQTGQLGGRILRGATQLGGVPVSPRRTLVLIQFFPRTPFDPSLTAGASVAAAVGLLARAEGETLLGFTLFGAALGASSNALAVRLPARAWILKGCIPIRYKAGSDFDGASAEVSIMELDVAVESFEEVSL